MLDNTDFHYCVLLCCPRIIVFFYVWLIEMRHYWTIVCRVTSSSFLAKKGRAHTTQMKLCEETDRLHSFHNLKWISELLHNRQEVRIFLGWNNTCQDNRHLQHHLELILDSLQKCIPLDQTTRKRILFDLQRNFCEPGTQTRIADVDNRFCREIEKSFCAGKFNPITVFSDNIRPQWELSIVIPTVRVEWATDRICSQLFHTCLQRKNRFP